MKTASIYKSDAGKTAIMTCYDSLLERLVVPHETRTVQTRHGRTWVLMSGEASAPPLILLHGTGSNSAMWLGDISHYSREYRVYAIDIIGDPGKSDSHRPELGGAAYAEWLEDTLDALNLQRVNLLGCSFGGWLSLKFAAAHPERVEKLLLLCPSGVIPAKVSFLFRAMLLLCFGDWGLKRLNRIVYGTQQVPEEADMFGRLIMKHFKPRYDAIPIFSDEELQRLTMPVMLIAGKQDALLHSEKTAARLKALLPQLRADVRPHVGHVLLDTADAFMTFLRVKRSEQFLVNAPESAVRHD